jgi:hypothetical protein
MRNEHITVQITFIDAPSSAASSSVMPTWIAGRYTEHEKTTGKGTADA